MAHHNELGKLGEKLAAVYLLKNGYEILAQYYYFDKSEIDIIANIVEDTLLVVYL